MSLVPIGFNEFDQGLIQDLSEGVARFISEQKTSRFWNKMTAPMAKSFFDFPVLH